MSLRKEVSNLFTMCYYNYTEYVYIKLSKMVEESTLEGNRTYYSFCGLHCVAVCRISKKARRKEN